MNAITVGPVPPLAMPMNAARNSTPVAMLNTPHPRLPRRMNRTPKMTVATVKAMNPIPPDARCARPCQLKAPGPAGVPGGNPSAGSAMKNPAPTWPAPKMLSNPRHCPQLQCPTDARRSGDDHQATEDEHTGVNPTERPVLHQAPAVPAQVEPGSQGRLDQRHSDVERTGDNSPTQQ